MVIFLHWKRIPRKNMLKLDKNFSHFWFDWINTNFWSKIWHKLFRSLNWTQIVKISNFCCAKYSVHSIRMREGPITLLEISSCWAAKQNCKIIHWLCWTIASCTSSTWLGWLHSRDCKMKQESDKKFFKWSESSNFFLLSFFSFPFPPP